MTLLTPRPGTSSSTAETALKTATGITVAESAVRGGSYVSIPAGGFPAAVEGSYVLVAGPRNLAPTTRGSYVTLGGIPVVAAPIIEGNYVTLPTAD
jgi:hypothetical protein